MPNYEKCKRIQSRMKIYVCPGCCGDVSAQIIKEVHTHEIWGRFEPEYYMSLICAKCKKSYQLTDYYEMKIKEET